MASILPEELQSLLSASLPQGSELVFHYLNSTPAGCDPLFVAPPNEAPQPTEWESHLLSVSIKHENSLVQILAIEALIYATSSLTTIFVSKADSTGYLHLAQLPKTSRSAIRCITSAFLEYLVSWKRSNRRLVLSLFARSQAQYLFPGSAENTSKHVLDDRQLIRWWCRILDDVLTKYKTRDNEHGSPKSDSQQNKSIAGYLIVPGLDSHEAWSYVPRNSNHWSTTSPVRQLSPYPDGPERCLIPRFPDDPKARFALDLDSELPENAIQPSDATEAPEPSKTGKWRSVRSLEQFWELVAFRQECAAGRVVGFLWVVFEPIVALETAKPALAQSDAANGISQLQSKAPADESAPATVLTDATPSADTKQSDSAPAQSASEPSGPPTALRVTSEAYATITSLMEQLDYADLTLAKTSTERFLSHAMDKAGLSGGTWGITIAGKRALEERPPQDTSKPANGVPTMLVGRKRKKEKVEEPSAVPATKAASIAEDEANAKRAKTEEPTNQPAA